MLSPRTEPGLRLFEVFLFVTTLATRELLAAPAHAQADASESMQRPDSRPSALAAGTTTAIRELFRQHCAKCHGADGKGSAVRSCMPEIPDFTAARWQERRREAQLKASVLDGKGADMPAWRAKVSEEQVRDLVAHVRAVAPTADKPGSGNQQESTAPGGFEEEFCRLQEELAESKRQFRALSAGSTDGERSKPSEASPRPAPSRPAPSSPRPFQTVSPEGGRGAGRPRVLSAALREVPRERQPGKPRTPLPARDPQLRRPCSASAAG
jgi:mono/diheme cytochrome c family protein